MIIDHCTAKNGLGEPRMKFGGAFWSASAPENHRVIFLKPFTYMNLSGKSVVEAARYHGIDPSGVLVIFDDAAMPFGSLRYRSGGSAGGHNGMTSILGGLGTLDVPRLRVGVGAPPPCVDMRDWVLGKFPREQRERWSDVEDLAWDSVIKWLDGSAGEGFTVRICEK
jgi:PTH1 family peptidyl-tRNA hydrolase